MVKKIISAFIVLVLVAIAFPAQVFAKQDSSLGRIYIYKPSVKVELYNVKDFDTCSVNLSNEKLKIERSGMYDAQEDKSLVYLLIDLSSSMNPVRFESVKKALCNFVKDMPEQDSLVLITFGESVKTVLNGDESVKERVNAISSLKCNQNQTTFYEALKKVYNDSIVEDDTFDRRFAIVVSDGVDVQKGSATKKEVTALYNNQGLPLFSLCDSYNTASTVNDLGELSRSSGADIFLYADNDASTVVSNLYSYVYKNVALIEARASNNDSNGKKQMLSVTIDNKQYSKNVEVLKSSADKEAPSAQIDFDESDYYTFTVEFSEPVNNADKIDSYTISNSKGKELAISSVKKISDTEYKLTMKRPVTSGDYTFDFNSITDKSVEKNPADSTTLNSVKSEQYTKKLIVIFAVAFIAFAALIAVIIVLAVKAKNKKQNESSIEDGRESRYFDHLQRASDYDEKHRVIFEEKQGIPVTINVIRKGTATQVINTKIYDSIIIGRADACDISVDDPRMSRQHFSIENIKGYAVIRDLETTNGTLVNSNKIFNPYKLDDGDEISAGTCKFKFYYSRNGE